MTLTRTAVLVDGGNISPAFSDHILSMARRLGAVDILRVYLDASRPSDWHSQSGWRVIHAGQGKNAADILLVIDAMQFALEGETENFLLATSDGDFSHLAIALKERGLQVHGMGEAKAPARFRDACHGFIELSVKSCAAPCENVVVGRADGTKVSDLDAKIKGIIQQHSRQGKGMRIVDLNPKMRQHHGMRISKMPEKTWRSYLSARPHLYDLDPRGPEAMVRFLPQGFHQN